MSKGTTSGLVDTPQAQSVFKHEVLWRYINYWIPMVAQSQANSRLYVVDGYAGPGRHLKDNTEASAAKLMAAAQRAKTPVECWLVERDPKLFAKLESVVAEFAAAGVCAFARQGDLGQHITEVLSHAAGSPLMLFFDPCGQLLPFATLAKLLVEDRPAKPRPVTELLANFSADYVRRVGGRWRNGHELSGEQLDLSLGGQWWRPIAKEAVDNDGGWAGAVGLIAHGFADRLASRTGMQAVVIPVQRSHHHSQPVYHLVLMTRSGHGQWMFADAVGRARNEWLLAHNTMSAEAEEAMFPHDEVVAVQVMSEHSRAESVIAANLRVLAARVPSFKPVAHTHHIYGGELGTATETQVNRALRELVQVGTLEKVRAASKPRDSVYKAADR